ncbi:MAG: hypothetical protein ACTSQI_06335 [Candidatus Helarchaeota archaeon]
MKYEETILEISYFKPNLAPSRQKQTHNLEAVKKIATYKLSL